MTKSHPMHRKKSIHMTFRRSWKVKRLFYRVSDLLDGVAASRKEKVKHES